MGETDLEVSVCVPHKPFAKGSAVHAQSNMQGLPEGYCDQAENQRYWDQAVLGNFWILAQTDERDLGNIPASNIDTAETPEGLCLRRKDHNIKYDFHYTCLYQL